MPIRIIHSAAEPGAAAEPGHPEAPAATAGDQQPSLVAQPDGDDRDEEGGDEGDQRAQRQEQAGRALVDPLLLQHARQPGQARIEGHRLHAEETAEPPAERRRQGRCPSCATGRGRARRAAGGDSSTTSAAGTAHTASAAGQPPSARSSGTEVAAASVPLRVSDIENAPVSAPVRSGKRTRMRTGSATCAIATPAPATSVPAKSQRRALHPPQGETGRRGGQTAHSTRSRAMRRPSRGASGASSPRQSTGPVVSRLDAVAERPRSARIVSSRGGRLANSVRRFRPSRRTAATIAAPPRAAGTAARGAAGRGEEA